MSGTSRQRTSLLVEALRESATTTGPSFTIAISSCASRPPTRSGSRRTMEMGGHRVHVAPDGRSGIAKARDLRPDVILCDIGLPDVDGYEVAAALRAEGLRPARLIALSGYAQPEDRRRAMEAGYDAHVSKPPAPEALLALVAEEP